MNIPYKPQFTIFAAVVALAVSVWIFDMCLRLMNEPDSYKLYLGGTGAFILILIWVTIVKNVIIRIWSKLNKA